MTRQQWWGAIFLIGVATVIVSPRLNCPYISVMVSLLGNSSLVFQMALIMYASVNPLIRFLEIISSKLLYGIENIL